MPKNNETIRYITDRKEQIKHLQLQIWINEKFPRAMQCKKDIARWKLMLAHLESLERAEVDLLSWTDSRG
jgi:hypothetical protein